MTAITVKSAHRHEWLELRKNGIGSSEVGTILGVNPYQTPYQLWRVKMGLDKPPEMNRYMKAGIYLEDAVARYFGDETQREIIKSSKDDFIVFNKEKPFLRVSPDRTYWLPNLPKNSENKGILECKTSQHEIDTADIPRTWFCQLQYQLGVSELQAGSLAWLSRGTNFGYADFVLDRDFFGWMVEEVKKFWMDYIEKKVEPPIVSVDDVLLKWDRHTDGKTVVLDLATFEAAKKLSQINASLSMMEKQKVELEEKVKLAMQDAETASYLGQPVATWRTQKPSEAIDTKRMISENPEIAEKYRFEKSGNRVFLLKLR